MQSDPEALAISPQRRAVTLVDGIPAWEFVSALSNAEVDAIAERVRREARVSAETFYEG